MLEEIFKKGQNQSQLNIQQEPSTILQSQIQQFLAKSSGDNYSTYTFFEKYKQFFSFPNFLAQLNKRLQYQLFDEDQPINQSFFQMILKKQMKQKMKQILYKKIQKNGFKINLDYQNQTKAYSKQNKKQKFQFFIQHNSQDYQIMLVRIEFGQFIKSYTVYKGQETSFRHNNLMINFGTFGNIYLIKFFDNKSNEFSCKSIKCTKYCPYQSQNIQNFKQIFISDLLSALQISPKFSSSVGFDFIIFKSCIEFQIQQCFNPSLKTVELDMKVNLFLMQALNIVHGDIKPSNIMYSNYFKRNVFIDFGTSDILSQKIGQKTLSNFKGTYQYCSDQMKSALSKRSSLFIDLYKNDIVSLDKTLKQFLFNYEPSNKQKIQNHKQQIVRNPSQIKNASKIRKKDYLEILQNKQEQFYIFSELLRIKHYLYNTCRLFTFQQEKFYHVQDEIIKYFLKIVNLKDKPIIEQYFSQLAKFTLKLTPEIKILVQNTLPTQSIKGLELQKQEIQGNYFSFQNQKNHLKKQMQSFQIKHQQILNILGFYSYNSIKKSSQSKLFHRYLLKITKIKLQNIEFVLFHQDQCLKIQIQEYFTIFLTYVSFWECNYQGITIQNKRKAAQIFKKIVQEKQINIQSEYLKQIYFPDDQKIKTKLKPLIWVYGFLLSYCTNEPYSQFKAKHIMLIYKQTILLNFKYFLYSAKIISQYIKQLIEMKTNQHLSLVLIQLLDIFQLELYHFSFITTNTQQFSKWNIDLNQIEQMEKYDYTKIYQRIQKIEYEDIQKQKVKQQILKLLKIYLYLKNISPRLYAHEQFQMKKIIINQRIRQLHSMIWEQLLSYNFQQKINRKYFQYLYQIIKTYIGFSNQLRLFNFPQGNPQIKDVFNFIGNSINYYQENNMNIFSCNRYYLQTIRSNGYCLLKNIYSKEDATFINNINQRINCNEISIYIMFHHKLKYYLSRQTEINITQLKYIIDIILQKNTLFINRHSYIYQCSCFTINNQQVYRDNNYFIAYYLSIFYSRTNLFESMLEKSYKNSANSTNNKRNIIKCDNFTIANDFQELNNDQFLIITAIINGLSGMSLSQRILLQQKMRQKWNDKFFNLIQSVIDIQSTSKSKIIYLKCLLSLLQKPYSKEHFKSKLLFFQSYIKYTNNLIYLKQISLYLLITNINIYPKDKNQSFQYQQNSSKWQNSKLLRTLVASDGVDFSLTSLMNKVGSSLIQIQVLFYISKLSINTRHNQIKNLYYVLIGIFQTFQFIQTQVFLTQFIQKSKKYMSNNQLKPNLLVIFLIVLRFKQKFSKSMMKYWRQMLINTCQIYQKYRKIHRIKILNHFFFSIYLISFVYLQQRNAKRKKYLFLKRECFRYNLTLENFSSVNEFGQSPYKIILQKQFRQLNVQIKKENKQYLVRKMKKKYDKALMNIQINFKLIQQGILSYQKGLNIVQEDIKKVRTEYKFNQKYKIFNISLFDIQQEYQNSILYEFSKLLKLEQKIKQQQKIIQKIEQKIEQIIQSQQIIQLRQEIQDKQNKKSMNFKTQCKIKYQSQSTKQQSNCLKYQSFCIKDQNGQKSQDLRQKINKLRQQYDIKLQQINLKVQNIKNSPQYQLYLKIKQKQLQKTHCQRKIILLTLIRLDRLTFSRQQNKFETIIDKDKSMIIQFTQKDNFIIEECQKFGVKIKGYNK